MEGEVRRELVRFGRLLYERRLISGLGGNLSARVDDSTILITPSGVSKGMMLEKDLIRMTVDRGEVISSGKPSMETPFHLTCYRHRPDVGAVIHAHPLYCTILAVAGETVRTDLTPEGLMVLGEVRLVPYETPGSEKLASRLAEALAGGGSAFLLERHGAITVGGDLAEAFHRIETLEFLAELQVRAEQAGKARPMPKDEAERVRAMGCGKRN
jgi:L-fuculose-phosphate aldolase